MQLLLDECTPKRLKNDFPGHRIQTVTEVGLNGLKNGQLLRAAVEGGFDVLITVDQRLRFQQNLSQFNLAVIILGAKPCRYPQLKLIVPKVVKTLKTIRPGDCVVVHRLSKVI
ncbi:MAG: hypothetical protein V7638_4038 [Acidobacteriota bacterium]|jgi:hypothetical protein